MPGDDFVEVIERQVRACDVFLAVIGRNWINIRTTDGRRRLDDQSDFVRIEIETALRLRKRVIPVLLDHAEMPAAADLPATLAGLSRRQAARLHHETFRRDAERLARVLRKQLAAAQADEQRKPHTPSRWQVANPSQTDDGGIPVADAIAPPEAVLTDAEASGDRGETGRSRGWLTREFRIGLVFLAGAAIFFTASMYDVGSAFGNSNAVPRVLCVMLFLIGLSILAESGHGQIVLTRIDWRALPVMTIASALSAVSVAWVGLQIALGFAVLASCLAVSDLPLRRNYVVVLSASAVLAILYGSRLVSGPILGSRF
jgi:hypothetical protein